MGLRLCLRFVFSFRPVPSSHKRADKEFFRKFMRNINLKGLLNQADKFPRPEYFTDEESSLSLKGFFLFFIIGTRLIRCPYTESTVLKEGGSSPRHDGSDSDSNRGALRWRELFPRLLSL